MAFEVNKVHWKGFGAFVSQATSVSRGNLDTKLQSIEMGDVGKKKALFGFSQ
jgi:hypothetical protein